MKYALFCLGRDKIFSIGYCWYQCQLILILLNIFLTSLLLSTFMQQTFYQICLKSGMEDFTHHHGLLTQISDDGTYWHVIDNASQKDTISNSNNCLSEVILDLVIKEVVSLMFGVDKDTNTWTDSIKTFAFGN